MENKISTIKERILQILDYKGISKERFFNKIGVTYANFKGGAKKTPLNSNTIENIFAEFPDINLEWLLTGNGEMIKNPPVAKLSKVKGKGIPLIPIEEMSNLAHSKIQSTEHEYDRYIVPMFQEAEFLITVKGSSMVPKYNSGDIVACKSLSLNDIFFQWNKVYVLNTAQGALVKRVKEGSDNRHLLIVSDNENYQPFELDLNQIKSVALVIGAISLE